MHKFSFYPCTIHIVFFLSNFLCARDVFLSTLSCTQCIFLSSCTLSCLSIQLCVLTVLSIQLCALVVFLSNYVRTSCLSIQHTHCTRVHVIFLSKHTWCTDGSFYPNTHALARLSIQSWCMDDLSIQTHTHWLVFLSSGAWMIFLSKHDTLAIFLSSRHT